MPDGGTKGLFEEAIAALSDKHSQLDVRLEGLTISLGDSRVAVRLTGALSIAIHMRDLTTAEKDAHASANIARIQS
jgi:hypothetical protein